MALRLNRLERFMQMIDRVTNGVRKLGIQQEKFKKPLIRQVGRINLAVGLESSTATQQSYPFKIFIGIHRLFRRSYNLMVIHIHQHGRIRSTLQKTSNLQELPSFTMT